MSVTINLLPPEMRPKERPDLVEVLPWAGAAAIVLLMAGGFGYLRFVEQASAEEVRNELQVEHQSLQPKVNYAVALKGEESDYGKRVETIEKIAASRVLWSRKLDQLCDVVQDDGDGQDYMVWLQTLEVKPGRPTGRKKRGQAPAGDNVELDVVCFSAVQALSSFNRFHAALKSSTFFAQDGNGINPPAGSARLFDDELDPKHAWTAKVVMSFNTPSPDNKRRKVRAN